MLKKQHFELLKLIENEKKLSKVAEFLNLTERSVRYKIDEINEELGSKKIEIKKREFFSSLTDEDMIKLIDNIEGENYVYNQREREELIILYTLMRKDNFLLKEVAEKIGTSKSTIRNDLKSLKKILLEYNIRLLQDDKLKYYFDYLEEDYRYFITTYLYKYVSFDKKYDKIFFDDISYFRKVIYKEIKEEYMLEIESISKRIKEVDLDFMDETINILVILMVISRKREKQNSNDIRYYFKGSIGDNSLPKYQLSFLAIADSSVGNLLLQRDDWNITFHNVPIRICTVQIVIAINSILVIQNTKYYGTEKGQ